MKPVGLKSSNLSEYRKNEELKERIEALEKEISNLKKMSTGEAMLEAQIEEKTKALKLLQTEFLAL